MYTNIEFNTLRKPRLKTTEFNRLVDVIFLLNYQKSRQQNTMFK